VKITKRQLRRIIREMHPRAGVDDAIFNYEEWARERGSPPGASSVIASYFVSKGSFSAPDMRMLGDHYGISVEDIQREVSTQRKEISAGGLSQEVPELTGGRRSSWQVRKEKELGESVKITKRQLRRIIKEEKARLLNEQGPPSMDAKTADAAQLLQTAYYNLDDLVGGSTDDGVVDDVLMNMELIKNALHILGVVL